ncbi:MAG TPA: ABC transporter ATP-binding protein, partial [Bacteroidota bacterium]|nr:ABC transporter ATP-binding protein [Bacteroidota bacterium]
DIAARFKTSAKTVDGTVRIERSNGHEFIPELVQAFPGQIESITLAKPTLEDVFIGKTGRKFEDEVNGNNQ